MTTSNTSLRIQKVRLTRKQVIIHYFNNAEKLTLESSDMPLPEFKTAIEGLIPLVLAICHLPEDYKVNMRATGITVTDKDMVTVQALKSFDDASGPLNIATPLRLLEAAGDDNPSIPLNDEQNVIIEAVIVAAKDYVIGNRAQGQLALEDGGTKKKKSGGDEAQLEGSTQSNEPDQEEIAAVPKKRGRKPKAEGQGD